VAPILPPATLNVEGQIVSMAGETGRVEVKISDKQSGRLYVEASYEFGLHRMAAPAVQAASASAAAGEALVLVSGAHGALGAALMRALGEGGLAIGRDPLSGRADTAAVSEALQGRQVAAIVHCAWPAPDNRRFTDLSEPELAIGEHVAGPLRDVQALAALLMKRGVPNAPLILIGSTAAAPGRHFFRSPLYSIAKSMVPALVDVLALELAAKSMRCLGAVFDVIDGGMNKGISAGVRQAHADRSPWGGVATPDDAAGQIAWLLANQSKLISGAMVSLSGGAVP
jgi:NAD(P)-dependent dehydrogenase (short-subunit alcohol dehydrogenase family)